MSWLTATIELGEVASAPVEAALLALGAISIEYRDAGDEPILEPAPGETPLWSRLAVAALLPAETEPDSLRLAIAAAAQPLPAPKLQLQRLDDRDWLAAWRASLAPRRFSGGLWVIPREHTPPANADHVVWLDPGLAFGSGSHPTTSLCLDWIADRVTAGSLLDYGCGSGILGLAGLVMGARQLVSVDIDPQALSATAANARFNRQAAATEILAPQDLPAGRQFDFVVANILSGILIDLAPQLSGHCKSGASIALTGILTEQTEQVCAAYAPWFGALSVQERDGWVLLSGTANF
jgi:ribosomal protein L11 methyltransferase